jgi:hypothetical protein
MEASLHWSVEGIPSCRVVEHRKFSAKSMALVKPLYHQPQLLPKPFSSPNFSIFSHPQPSNSSPQLPHTMGTGKKEANRKIRQGKVGDGMANVKTKGENFYRFVSLESTFLSKDRG